MSVQPREEGVAYLLMQGPVSANMQTRRHGIDLDKPQPLPQKERVAQVARSCMEPAELTIESEVVENLKNAAWLYRFVASQGCLPHEMLDQNEQRVELGDAGGVAWFRARAKAGDVTAQINLGRMYEVGKGVARDEKEALYWYQLAANQQSATAQHHLDRMLEKTIDHLLVQEEKCDETKPRRARSLLSFWTRFKGWSRLET